MRLKCEGKKSDGKGRLGRFRDGKFRYVLIRDIAFMSRDAPAYMGPVLSSLPLFRSLFHHHLNAPDSRGTINTYHKINIKKNGDQNDFGWIALSQLLFSRFGSVYYKETNRCYKY